MARKASPAQLAARAKFVAAVKSGKFRRRSRKWKPLGRSKIGRAISAAVARSKPNPAKGRGTVARSKAAKLARDLRAIKTPNLTAREKARAMRSHVKTYLKARERNPAGGRFQVTALCRGKLCYLSGLGLSTNREAASNYSFLPAARKAAGQVRDVGRKLGVTKVAIVTAHDPPAKIRSFLLGEAPRAAGEIR